MPRYGYMARNTAGDALEGEIAAHSPTEAAKLLRADGKFVVKLNEIADAIDAATPQVSFGGKRVKADEVIFFATQMAVMVDTGVSITETLDGIIEQSRSPAFKKILQQVLADVETGQQLSVALARHPKVFKPLFVNLVKASEVSGKLGPLLERCANYLSGQRETRKKIVGAMIYPVFLMCMSIGVTIFLIAFLLPKFSAIYAGREAVLPTPTKILMAVSGWVTANGMWLAAAGVILPILAVIYFRSRRGNRVWHWLLLNIPLVGRMLHQTYLARSVRTLGTLIDSGVFMPDAVSITHAVVGNPYYQDMWDEVDTRIQRGEQLSALLFETNLVPRPITQMIKAGERSGHLGTSLERVADFTEKDLDQTIKRVTQLIEPVMIFVMGTIVGSIAIALLLPIFTISKVLHQ